MRGKGACPAGVHGGGVRTSRLVGEAAQRQVGGDKGREAGAGPREEEGLAHNLLGAGDRGP